MAFRDNRSAEAQAYRPLYKTARWRRERERQLTEHPLCAMCESAGRITAATVCDHVDPKDKLDPERFFTGAKQSLCKTHHDSTKQREERRADSGRLPIQACGPDGWPI